ncbi:MAG: 6,7-dimethyl-8-ribityllumazine synthase [Gammaproteobacteria bacterium]
MSKSKLISGTMAADANAKVGVIVGRFNSFIVDQLESGCIETLKRCGVADENITIIKVPGAFEMPVVAKQLAKHNKVDAVIALGAVIRGSTPHFDYVCGTCSSGLANVAAETGVPMVFGVLTTDTIEQAIERAGTKAGNKGIDAAHTAVEMISVMRQL